MLLEDGLCFCDQVLSFSAIVLKNELSVKTQKTILTTVLALVGAGAGVTLVLAMSQSGSWITDASIALRCEETGTAKRSVILAFRKSYPRRLLVEKLADTVCVVVPDTVYPMRR